MTKTTDEDGCHGQGCWQKNFQWEGGGNEKKKVRKIAMKSENSIIKPLPEGERCMVFMLILIMYRIKCCSIHTE